MQINGTKWINFGMSWQRGCRVLGLWSFGWPCRASKDNKELEEQKVSIMTKVYFLAWFPRISFFLMFRFLRHKVCHGISPWKKKRRYAQFVEFNIISQIYEFKKNLSSVGRLDLNMNCYPLICNVTDQQFIIPLISKLLWHAKLQVHA